MIQNASSDKIFWNIPNLLTYGRIIAVPMVAGLILLGEGWARWLASFVYIVAVLTDFLDGYLARLWRQQSSLGRMLDPIADKVLVAVVLLVLAADGILAGGHIWAAIIIMAREVLVSGLREYLGALHVSVPVTHIAKWKTSVQMTAIGLLIAAPAVSDRLFSPSLNIFVLLGIVGLWIAAALTLYTGYDYFRASLHHVMEEE